MCASLLSDEQLARAEGIIAVYLVVIDAPLIARMHRCREATVRSTPQLRPAPQHVASGRSCSVGLQNIPKSDIARKRQCLLQE
jgi:hypothetical protein